MKEYKFVRARTWGFHNMHPPRGASSKGSYKLVGIIMVGLFTVALLRTSPGFVPEIPAAAETDDLVEIRAYEKGVASNSVALLSHRNVSFSFVPRVDNWDSQRRVWLKSNFDVRAGRPKVLLLTGSRPTPCQRPIDTHMFLKSGKNKVHYCRLHDIQMSYNMLEPHDELNGAWVKLPAVRMQMLAHPEVEWFWWVDSDAVFTDMESELPLKKYANYNLVVHGDERRVHNDKDWEALSSGNFLIRNCQWSLHFLDAWASMGLAHSREDVGKMLSDSLKGRPLGVDADDQSSLVYLLTREKRLWASKVYLEEEFYLTGAWLEVTDRLEDMRHGDPRLPLVTHFAACSQCDGITGPWPWEKCQRGMERAMDFADNQVYGRYGYQLRALGSSELVAIPGFILEPEIAFTGGLSDELKAELQGIPLHTLPGPKVTDWDAQREAWLEKNPSVRRTNAFGRPKMMIVTGSSTRECTRPIGSHYLLKSLKNKVDYARIHDLDMFYGMADFDPQLNDWWTKIPTIRMLMITRPDVEWFWWCDGDAIVTDMIFDIRFENYEGKNFLLYGDKNLVAARDWIAINAGVYLVRNCQWSLDLFDVWASYGAKAVRKESGRMISKALVGREPDIDADDQSTLLYLLVTDSQKLWGPKICLERSITISGYWKIITNRFEEMRKISHPGLGNMDWPWITHFAGCQPCGTKLGNFPLEECLEEMGRSFDFADNQILSVYGLEHSPLGSADVRSLKP